MIQVKGLPPNFEEILKVFPAAAAPNVMFAYGDVIYVPSGNSVPQELYDHERVHGSRQTTTGVERWWQLYLEDSEFRRDEELVAHIAEYKSFCARNRDRNARAAYLSTIALRFASPLYRLGVGHREAARMIVDKHR